MNNPDKKRGIFSYIRNLFRRKQPTLFGMDATPENCRYMEEQYTILAQELANTQRHLLNIYQDRIEGALVEVSIVDGLKQALSSFDPEHPALRNEPPSFGVWEKLRNTVNEQNTRILQLQESIQRYIVNNREMRSLLLRIHSARVAMNPAQVAKALDDVDTYFAKQEKEDQ